MSIWLILGLLAAGAYLATQSGSSDVESVEEQGLPTGSVNPKVELVDQLLKRADDFWVVLSTKDADPKAVVTRVDKAMVDHQTAIKTLLTKEAALYEVGKGQSRASEAAWLLIATQASSQSTATEPSIKKYLERYTTGFSDDIWQKIKSDMGELDFLGSPFALAVLKTTLAVYYYGDDSGACKPFALCALLPSVQSPESFRPDFNEFERIRTLKFLSQADMQAQAAKGLPTQAAQSSGYYQSLASFTGDGTVTTEFLKDNVLSALSLIKKSLETNPFSTLVYGSQALYTFNWTTYAPRSNTPELDTFAKNAETNAKSPVVGRQIRSFYESLINAIATSIGKEKGISPDQWMSLVGAAWDGWNEGIGLRRSSANYQSLKPDDGITGIAFAYKYASDLAARLKP